MNQLNWFWIGISLTVPPIVGGLIAFPFWRRDQAIFAAEPFPQRGLGQRLQKIDGQERDA